MQSLVVNERVFIPAEAFEMQAVRSGGPGGQSGGGAMSSLSEADRTKVREAMQKALKGRSMQDLTQEERAAVMAEVRKAVPALAAMQRGATPEQQRQGFSTPTSRPRIVPAIVFHGDRDTTVHPRNTDQLIAQWAALYASQPGSAAAAKPRVTVQRGHVPAGQAYTCAVYHDPHGQAIVEQWQIHGAGHAWSGGSRSGSFTNPNGPDATREMLRFFAAHPLK